MIRALVNHPQAPAYLLSLPTDTIQGPGPLTAREGNHFKRHLPPPPNSFSGGSVLGPRWWAVTSRQKNWMGARGNAARTEKITELKSTSLSQKGDFGSQSLLTLSYIICGRAIQRQYFVSCLKFFNLALKQTDLQQQNRVIMSENNIGSMCTVVLIAFKNPTF